MEHSSPNSHKPLPHLPIGRSIRTSFTIMLVVIASLLGISAVWIAFAALPGAAMMMLAMYVKLPVALMVSRVNRLENVPRFRMKYPRRAPDMVSQFGPVGSYKPRTQDTHTQDAHTRSVPVRGQLAGKTLQQTAYCLSTSLKDNQ